MYQCKICSKKFKTTQALGGHVQQAHPQKQEQKDIDLDSQQKDVTSPTAAIEQAAGEPSEHPHAQAPPSSAPVPPVVSEVVSEEPGKAEQIRDYLKRGYTLDQLKDRFGFAETTVRQEIAKMIPPEGESMVEETATSDGIPMTRKSTEVLNPEAVLRSYTADSAESKAELRGMIKLRAAMLMVMDLVNIQKTAAEADAKRLEPILKLMTVAREEQDAAAARAKESSKEIAERAAYEGARMLAEQVVPEVRTLMEKQIPAAAGPSLMGRMFTPMIDMMGKQMGNMFQGMFMPGMGGFPSQPGQGQPGDEQPSQSPPSQFNQMTDEERASIFGGEA